jgi:hypothetical protein
VGVLGNGIGDIGRRTGALTFPDLLRDRVESARPSGFCRAAQSLMSHYTVVNIAFVGIAVGFCRLY